jgi:phospholipid transport system substrate-binding protein
MRAILLSAVLLLGLAPAMPQANDSAAPAAVASKAPDELIRDTTDRLLSTVESARDYYDDNPQRYFGEIESIITPIVDFYSFSRGVMGQWGSRAYYASLKSDAERQQFEDQVARFSEVFRASLVETYSKGLLAFGGEKIEVSPVSESDLDAGRTYVVQTIVPPDNSEPHVIRYLMRRDENGWQIRNVILDEINLGRVYRNQFAAAVSKYNGDVDKVIENWKTGGIDAETGE